MDYLADCRESLLNSELRDVYFISEERTKTFLIEGLTKEEIFVALDQSGVCLGFIWIALAGAFCRFPYVDLLAVKERYRGRGVGCSLLSFFEQEGFKKAPKLFIMVSDFNHRAKKLYESRGYKEVGMIPEFLKPGVAEYIMMKSK
jgi:ribosomal protein S18 acetylase RimI-like enzyme